MTPEERLKRWKPYEHSAGWLGDCARIAITKLEAEIAEQFGPEPIIPLSDFEKGIIDEQKEYKPCHKS